MQQLTGLDAAFLALDSPTVYGHVGSVSVLDPAGAPEPLTLERVTRLVEDRLPLIPPFRRKLVTVPLGLDQPYWVEDADFDIEFHVRELALPAPGSHRQLADQAARLHARPLDRSRPLWELYLIHGLEGGKVAVYTKVHHAAIDGISGNDIVSALMDRSRQGRPPAHARVERSVDRPSAAGLLVRSALHLARQPLRAARLSAGLVAALPAVAGSPVRPELPVVDRLLLRRGRSVVLNQPPLRAPATPFNRSVGPHRRWAFGCLPLADAKAVKGATGTTVNDVVMALCAGALRTWLQEHGALPPGPLVAAVPVSVRTEEEAGAHGNRVSALLAPLPTHLDDPLARLRAVHEAMRAAKEQHQAMPANLLADVAQFAMPAVANQASRLAARLRLMERANPFNLIVSNVPGPAVELFMCGARLEGIYPLSAVAEGQGLNITILGLGGQLHVGIVADRDLVPDVDRIMEAMGEELGLLRDAVEQAGAATGR